MYACKSEPALLGVSVRRLGKARLTRQRTRQRAIVSGSACCISRWVMVRVLFSYCVDAVFFVGEVVGCFVEEIDYLLDGVLIVVWIRRHALDVSDDL